jgi:hypothetical protein
MDSIDERLLEYLDEDDELRLDAVQPDFGATFVRRALRKPPARLRRLNSSIATPHRCDLGELWIKSGFRCVM